MKGNEELDKSIFMKGQRQIEVDQKRMGRKKFSISKDNSFKEFYCEAIYVIRTACKWHQDLFDCLKNENNMSSWWWWLRKGKINNTSKKRDKYWINGHLQVRRNEIQCARGKNGFYLNTDDWQLMCYDTELGLEREVSRMTHCWLM